MLFVKCSNPEDDLEPTLNDSLLLLPMHTFPQNSKSYNPKTKRKKEEKKRENVP